MNLQEIGLYVFSAIMGVTSWLLKNSFNEMQSEVRGLKSAHHDLQKDYYQTREQLIRLQEKAVTREQMDSVLKEFEVKLNANLNTLFQQQTQLFHERFESLKELINTIKTKP